MTAAQCKWIIGLWLVCAVVYLAFAVRSCAHGHYGIMGGQLFLAAFYAAAGVLFRRLNRRSS